MLEVGDYCIHGLQYEKNEIFEIKDSSVRGHP